MPKATMSEENEWKLPKDVPLPARLALVKERRVDYTNRDTGQPDFFVEWEWEFQITDGEYAGLKAWGSTPPKLTTHEQNKTRHWAEALTGHTYQPEEGLDTDDLLGIDCLIVVDNTTYVKKGTTETKYLCPVKDVYPADAASIEPPF